MGSDAEPQRWLNNLPRGSGCGRGCLQQPVYPLEKPPRSAAIPAGLDEYRRARAINFYVARGVNQAIWATDWAWSPSISQQVMGRAIAGDCQPVAVTV